MQLSLSKLFFYGLVACVSCSTLYANSGEISLNDSSFKLQVDWSLGNNGIETEAAILHHEDRGDVASFAAMKFGNAGNEGLEAGIGVKLAYVDPDYSPEVVIAIFPPPDFSSPSGAAVALGGKVRYVPAEYNRLNVGAYAWFSPDVLTLDKLDKYQELGVYVGYNVIRDADLFVGYRNVKAGFKSYPDITLDSGLHIGMRASF